MAPRSAVHLPEVFLKAVSIAQNLGHELSGFATANLDMVRQYRTDENVLRRPTLGKGRSFSLLGHHELNVPLLAAACGLERARRESGRYSVLPRYASRARARIVMARRS